MAPRAAVTVRDRCSSAVRHAGRWGRSAGLPVPLRRRTRGPGIRVLTARMRRLLRESIEILFMRQPPAGGLRRSTTHHCVTPRNRFDVPFGSGRQASTARHRECARRPGPGGYTSGLPEGSVPPSSEGFPSGPARSQQPLRHRKGATRDFVPPGCEVSPAFEWCVHARDAAMPSPEGAGRVAESVVEPRR